MPLTKITNEKLIIALDDIPLETGLDLASTIGPSVYAIKIHNWFDEYGPSIITKLREAGARRVWVDAKLHDIPHTVSLRAKAMSQAGADILTVHASGGVDMMRAAVDSGIDEVYAVTLLTSLDHNSIQHIYNQTSEAVVSSLAHVATRAGMHGITCSPNELAFLTRDPSLRKLKFITPGIRSAGSTQDDQSRTNTAAAAIAAGAHHIVIGREVTRATEPGKMLEEIMKQAKSSAP